LRHPRKVAAAMQRAVESTSTKIVITTADNRGVQISIQKSAIRN